MENVPQRKTMNAVQVFPHDVNFIRSIHEVLGLLYNDDIALKIFLPILVNPTSSIGSASGFDIKSSMDTVGL